MANAIVTTRGDAMSGPLTDADALRRARVAELAAARDSYALEARRGQAGRDVLARYADRMDGLVRDIAAPVCAQTTTPLVVCALGGYGRRTLCLHSDVDLLVAFGGEIGPAEERAVSALLQPLWDLRLTVGQHVRELSDFDRVEPDNAELLLSLLDLRMVAGDESLFGDLRDRLECTAAERARDGIAALLELLEQRHARFNQTVYQLEPDVKDAPGALRDLEAVRIMRALRPEVVGAIAEAELERAREAEDFLLRIRSVLHLNAGRNSNVLTHELQETVADAFAYRSPSSQQRVEALMSDYFRRARPILRSVETSRNRIRPRVEPVAPRHIGRYIDITADGVRFTDEERVASMPALWLEAFRIALAYGCPVSDQVRACIEQNVAKFTADDFVATEGDRQQLLQLLRPRPGLYARLSEMHDCGLLGCIFPEFEGIHSRVIRDFYHRYTVDEHTLLAIRSVESLLTPTSTRERFSAMLDELHAPELLTLALLYHDVGKWRDEEHAAESVRLADPMLDRLQLAPEGRSTVTFLIKQHLEMSQAAFRRDSEDPDVVARFASLVRTEEHLKMLCLLTLADIAAVNPETLTPWKEELIWRLYVDTYNRLTFGYADELIQTDHAGLEVVVAGRPDDITESELWAFLDGLPRRYVALFGLATVYRHVRLARDIHPDEVHASLEKHDKVWELSVVTLDKPYLFSNISGVLSYFGMDIHRGQAMTTPQGLVLDVFEFSDEEQFLAQNPGGAAEIHRVLQSVVQGSIDVTDLLRGKERSILYRRRPRVAPVVHFDNEHSQSYTVLEIVADDAIGLLYRLSRAVSRQGCDLDLALISTEGKKAIDVLHVTKQGNKLSDADQAALTQELERMLEGTHEAGEEHRSPKQGGRRP
jgi:[protein-PII] uridylyltransferase